MTQIRAIVYGVGLSNRIATRLMVEKGVQVVGAVNRSGPKVGKDLGILTGLGYPLGVTAAAKTYLQTKTVKRICEENVVLFTNRWRNEAG